MKVSDLIGQKVIRTKPVQYGNGSTDRSYSCDTETKIVAVSEHHFQITSRFSPDPHTLDRATWDDGNWEKYPFAQ